MKRMMCITRRSYIPPRERNEMQLLYQTYDTKEHIYIVVSIALHEWASCNVYSARNSTYLKDC
jgi:hypothetical protein